MLSKSVIFTSYVKTRVQGSLVVISNQVAKNIKNYRQITAVTGRDCTVNVVRGYPAGAANIPFVHGTFLSVQAHSH